MPPRGIKTASEAEERRLIANAEALAEDPTLLLPECVHDDADGCHLRKVEKKLRKVHGKQGDKKKLERASGGFFGHDLAKALAATLILAEEGEAPYLGQVGMAGRRVAYAKRGKADKRDLAAVQHHDDPRLRVLPLADDIEKKGLHVYSCGDGWWCTGTRADPPEAFVEAMVGRLDAVRERSPGVIACPHVQPDDVGTDGPAHLVVEWTTADRRIARCEQCVDGHTALELTAGIASPDPTAEFDVDVHLPVPTCRGHEDACPAADAYRRGFDVSGYLDGDVDDRGLFDACREQIRTRLRDNPRFFLAKDVCHGDDVDGFLDALGASGMERTALSPVLAERSDPVVTGASTANRLLAELWSDHARTFLTTVANEGIADELIEERDPGQTPPTEILAAARDRHDRRSLTDRLPSYDDLPAPVEIADRVARTHRLEGRKAAIRRCDPDRSWDPTSKSVAYGFLLTFDADSGEEWKFTEEERESGEFLQDRVRALLEADPGDYHDALTDVARAAGVTQGFEPAD